MNFHGLPPGLGRAVSRAQHAWHVLHRINSLVVLGLVILLSSHWLARESEAKWARDVGTALVVYAYTRWVTHQGRRRTNSDGQLVRPTTLTFGPEETADIRRKIRDRKR